MERLRTELREHALASTEELDRSSYPGLDNISAGHIFAFVPRPRRLASPELVFIPIPTERVISDDYPTKVFLAITEWNALWEAGQLRPDFFASFRHLPEEFNWLKNYRNSNLYLIPDGKNAEYDAYVPLYHLIPYRTLVKHNLPAFKRGLWPPWAAPRSELSDFINKEFGNHLSSAFATHIWPLIDKGSRIRAFSKDYSLKLLAHNLNFWLPYAIQVVERRLKEFSFVPFESMEQRRKLRKIRASLPSGILAGRPRRGGTVWMGEDEAWEATKEIVRLADNKGKLSEIIDAIRSNHIEDDFSKEWSYAKEDFERKIYHKRSKIKVTFVELRDTIPVHGPTSELHENLLWEDFIALLDNKEKHIVICLRNGVSKVGDIANSLGYATHSPISKALSKIRIKAKAYLGL